MKTPLPENPVDRYTYAGCDEGPALDLAVAACRGDIWVGDWHAPPTDGSVSFKLAPDGTPCLLDGTPYRPTTEWRHGGPVMEEELLSCFPVGPLGVAGEFLWRSETMTDAYDQSELGATPLLAIARCYVARAMALALDEFAIGYISCALWSTAGAAPDGTEHESLEDFALGAETENALWADCRGFVMTQCYALRRAVREREGYTYGQAGHDFWLTREGHGAGFWDRGLGDLGTTLTQAAKAYQGFDLYIGDDGLVHH